MASLGIDDGSPHHPPIITPFLRWDWEPVPKLGLKDRAWKGLTWKGLTWLTQVLCSFLLEGICGSEEKCSTFS